MSTSAAVSAAPSAVRSSGGHRATVATSPMPRPGAPPGRTRRVDRPRSAGGRGRQVGGRARGADRYGGGVSASAWGDGLATVTDGGRVLDVWFPAPARPRGRRRHLAARVRVADRRGRAPRHPPAAAVRCGSTTCPRRRRTPRTRTCGCTCSAPGWSARTGCRLDGIFGVLPNVVWTSAGPVRCRRPSSETRLRLLVDGPVTVLGVDKFPRMTDYVVPAGVRIADARPGPARRPPGRGHHGDARGLRQLQRRHARPVDGRGPDLRRRGGRRRLRRRRRRVDHGHPVRRRQRGHLDRRAAACSARTPGIGISLGDDCVVEAGCYVTAGVQGDACRTARVVKARELSGRDGLLFRRNSVTGALEVVRPARRAGRPVLGRPQRRPARERLTSGLEGVPTVTRTIRRVARRPRRHRRGGRRWSRSACTRCSPGWTCRPRSRPAATSPTRRTR